MLDRLSKLIETLEAFAKAESLSKPPVSEAQRRAMHAAASGKSTIDIPKSVGKEFADADKGGKLPEKVSKMNPMLAGALTGGAMGAIQGAMGARKAVEKPEEDELKKKPKDKAEKAIKPGKGGFFAVEPTKPASTPASTKPATPPKPPGQAGAPQKENTIDYGSFKNKPKPDADHPTITMKPSGEVVRTPGSKEVEAGFKVPKAKLSALSNPSFKAKLAEQRKKAAVKKSEDFGKITESLTKSFRSMYPDNVIGLLLKSAVDARQLHHDVLVEWSNYKTINPVVLDLIKLDGE
jgi:type IV secretory pathway VirB10-like protein